MFRERDPQVSLFQSEFLVTPQKARLMQRSWAEVFRNRALPLIDERRFAPMYHPDNGRPNRAVETVLGVHILKEMFDLTDEEALEQLEFNLLWHHALRLTGEEAHLPRKTLHNFRVRLMTHDGGRGAFQETTDRIIQALGLRTGKQRLDSTHIISNIALLTRLGLFCETIRRFLGGVQREYPPLGQGIARGLAQRYRKDDGEATHYQDVRSGEGRRRLAVCARDPGSRPGPVPAGGPVPGDGGGDPHCRARPETTRHHGAGRSPALHPGGLSDRCHGGAGDGLSHWARVPGGVRLGADTPTGGDLFRQGGLRPLPPAGPLPSKTGPACGGLRPQGQPGANQHRGTPRGGGHRGVAQAVRSTSLRRGEIIGATPDWGPTDAHTRTPLPL